MKNIKENITKFQNQLFDIISVIIWILYFSVSIGLLSNNAPEYLHYLQLFVKIYVSLFLIYRFNFFRKITFNQFDSKIAFTSGLFLFSSIIFDIL
jgi:hypothetical protein